MADCHAPSLGAAAAFSSGIRFLFLRGCFDPPATPDATVLSPPHTAQTAKSRLLEALAGTTLVIGAGVTVFADPGWARALGIFCAILTFGLATAELDEKA